MKLDKGDIRICYNAGSETNFDLEDFFSLLLKLMGYQLYESNMDNETRIRSLNFGKKATK